MPLLNQTFETVEISYFNRIKINLFYIVLICLVILFLFRESSDIYFIIFLPVIILIFYGYEVLQWNKYYITRITINEENIVLSFYRYDILQTIVIPLHELEIELLFVWYKVRSPHCFLRFSKKGLKILDQHIGGYWDKNKMESIKSIFQQIKKGDSN